MTTHYPASAVRTLALASQRLHAPQAAKARPGRQQILDLVNHLGCVQIDTLHVVRRSQYLVLWSRLGNYDPADFDSLQSGPDRQLFEGWQHAACIIPLAEYRHQMPRQRHLRETPSAWYNRWLEQKTHPEVIEQVRDRIQREGPLKVSAFESTGHTGGSWWNWRPAKVALEYLFAFGELMIAERVNFQRLYDLTERVLPKWVDTTEPDATERDAFWVERGARGLGAGLVRHPGDYTWMKVTQSRPRVADLRAAGVLLPINVQMKDGSVAEMVIHQANLPLLQQAADGQLKAGRTTFLSPFDSLFWAIRRDELLWNFHQSLECYLPAPKRVYGYFSLPILHNDRLVGRLDPKLERKTGLLRLKALYLEPGVKPSEELITQVAAALRDFMDFHQAREVVIENSQPADFARKLLAKLS